VGCEYGRINCKIKEKFKKEALKIEKKGIK
jgi:hypothetical protein